MNRIACIAGIVVTLTLAAGAKASDPIGAYAVVDKVALEPNDDAPLQVKIWGTFALVKEAGGQAYEHPVRGYLYYKAEPGKAEVCRKEWADFKNIAGTAQIIGFGNSSSPEAMGHVRKTSAKPEAPDPYPLGFGLTRINLARARGYSDYQPLRELLTLPGPVTPADGERVAPGKVTLVTRNILDKRHAQATYEFEFENAAGDKEVSPAIAAGAKETKWSPQMEVKPGQKYTWRVRAVDGKWKGPAASSTMEGKSRS